MWSTIRNRMLKTAGSNFIIVTLPETLAGDICFYDKVNQTKIFVRGKFRKSDFPLDLYTPIGIVFVPGIHNVYGANTCGILSLPDMNCTTPTTGSVDVQSICFGPQVIQSTPTYNVVIIYNTDGSLKTNGFGYLSKSGNYAYSTLQIPDPYNSDMSRNPDYYNKTVSAYNAMADFNGKNNSNVILGIRGVKNYHTWTPVYNTAAHYPAVSCCDMFYTEGTAQGQWYLPAAGEWGYIMSKWNVIKKSITLLNKVYGNIAAQLTDNTSYWTSSQHNAKNNRYVHTDNGMGHTTKTTSMKIKACAIMKEPLTFPIHLYTESIDTDFYRRASDTLMLDIIDWYGCNCITTANGGSYLPSDILAGKLFVDDYEVKSIQFNPTSSSEFLIFETDYDYELGAPLKVIQYRQTTAVKKGTLDIM